MGEEGKGTKWNREVSKGKGQRENKGKGRQWKKQRRERDGLKRSAGE